MTQRHVRKRLHMRYPKPNMVPPIIQPIRWYMHMACIMVTMIPPRKRNERL